MHVIYYYYLANWKVEIVMGLGREPQQILGRIQNSDEGVPFLDTPQLKARR